MRFAGFTRVYEEGKDEERRGRQGTPAGVPGHVHGRPTTLDCRKLEPKQHFTEPPPRYTEASLVKALEDNGIGRPSTYSTIVETIQARGYVTQQERRFMPTEIGTAVNDLLGRAFPKIVNLKFTATMEGDLDRVGESATRTGSRCCAASTVRSRRARRRPRRSCRASSCATNRPTRSARTAAGRW